MTWLSNSAGVHLQPPLLIVPYGFQSLELGHTEGTYFNWLKHIKWAPYIWLLSFTYNGVVHDYTYIFIYWYYLLLLFPSWTLLHDWLNFLEGWWVGGRLGTLIHNRTSGSGLTTGEGLYVAWFRTLVWKTAIKVTTRIPWFRVRPQNYHLPQSLRVVYPKR